MQVTWESSRWRCPRCLGSPHLRTCARLPPHSPGLLQVSLCVDKVYLGLLLGARGLCVFPHSSRKRAGRGCVQWRCVRRGSPAGTCRGPCSGGCDVEDLPLSRPGWGKAPRSLASSPRGVQVSGRLSVQPSLTARGENCHGKLPLEPWAPRFTCLRALAELLPCGLPDGDPCCSWVSLSPRRSSCHPARAHFPGGGPSHTLPEHRTHSANQRRTKGPEPKALQAAGREGRPLHLTRHRCRHGALAPPEPPRGPDDGPLPWPPWCPSRLLQGLRGTQTQALSGWFPGPSRAHTLQPLREPQFSHL